MPIIPETYETLSAMITPALFMTATGSLIISTSNRMSRIVDRIRFLNLEGDDLSRGLKDADYKEDRLEHVSVQLDRMIRRSDRIRASLTLLYSAMAMFVGTSLTVALVTLVGTSLLFIPTTMAILGVTLLLSACIELLRETKISLLNNRLEILFHQKLRNLRAARAASSQGDGPSIET
jgi:Flp pilus assembly protein TadB